MKKEFENLDRAFCMAQRSYSSVNWNFVRVQGKIMIGKMIVQIFFDQIHTGTKDIHIDQFSGFFRYFLYQVGGRSR